MAKQTQQYNNLIKQFTSWTTRDFNVLYTNTNYLDNHDLLFYIFLYNLFTMTCTYLRIYGLSIQIGTHDNATTNQPSSIVSYMI